MEFQTFSYAYLADALEPHLDDLRWLDPVGTFRAIERFVDKEMPRRNEEATEPAHELKIVYRNDDDFKVSGRSYALFKIFAQNLIQWQWAPGKDDSFELPDVKYLKGLMEQLNAQIELEDTEFDTDVTFSIKAPKNDDAYIIKVATRYWSAKVEVLKY